MAGVLLHWGRRALGRMVIRAIGYAAGYRSGASGSGRQLGVRYRAIGFHGHSLAAAATGLSPARAGRQANRHSTAGLLFADCAGPAAPFWPGFSLFITGNTGLPGAGIPCRLCRVYLFRARAFVAGRAGPPSGRPGIGQRAFHVPGGRASGVRRHRGRRAGPGAGPARARGRASGTGVGASDIGRFGQRPRLGITGGGRRAPAAGRPAGGPGHRPGRRARPARDNFTQFRRR